MLRILLFEKNPNSLQFLDLDIATKKKLDHSGQKNFCGHSH